MVCGDGVSKAYVGAMYPEGTPLCFARGCEGVEACCWLCEG